MEVSWITVADGVHSNSWSQCAADMMTATASTVQAGPGQGQCSANLWNLHFACLSAFICQEHNETVTGTKNIVPATVPQATFTGSMGLVAAVAMGFLEFWFGGS